MRSPNDCPLLWTYLGHNCLVTNLIWPITASLKEAPTTALHHAPRQPAEEEKFTGASEALVRVTYKEFVARRPWSPPLVCCGSREEEAFLGVPGSHVVVLLADQWCRLWQVLTPLVIGVIAPEIIKILPLLSSSLVLARLYPKTNLGKTESNRPKKL